MLVYETKPHVPDLVIRGGVTYRVITDHLGSVRRLVNTSTGAVAQAFEYDAWGRITSSSCNGVATCEDLQPFRYAGGLYDRDTGLTRFGAWDYDAEIGRWTAKDPIGFEGVMYPGLESILVPPSRDPGGGQACCRRGGEFSCRTTLAHGGGNEARSRAARTIARHEPFV